MDIVYHAEKKRIVESGFLFRLFTAATRAALFQVLAVQVLLG